MQNGMQGKTKTIQDNPDYVCDERQVFLPVVEIPLDCCFGATIVAVGTAFGTINDSLHT